MTKFPEAVKVTGTGIEEEFLFLWQQGKNKKFSLMKAKKDGVVEVDVREGRGLKLPVYIRLISTYIGTGNIEKMA